MSLSDPHLLLAPGPHLGSQVKGQPQHRVPLTLNSTPPEMVMMASCSFLNCWQIQRYVILCLIYFHAGCVLALSFWLKEPVSLLAIPGTPAPPQAR